MSADTEGTEDVDVVFVNWENIETKGEIEENERGVLIEFALFGGHIQQCSSGIHSWQCSGGSI